MSAIHTRLSKVTIQVRLYLKTFSVTLKNRTFQGMDPIHVFDFLACFVNETDMLHMFKGQAFNALPTLQAEPIET